MPDDRPANTRQRISPSASRLNCHDVRPGWAPRLRNRRACASVWARRRKLSVGNVAHNGLWSALLAQKGFDGPPEPLAGVQGLVGYLLFFAANYDQLQERQPSIQAAHEIHLVAIGSTSRRLGSVQNLSHIHHATASVSDCCC
jgi:hypothetical protein